MEISILIIHNSFILKLQTSVQVILASDGDVSLAIFVHEGFNFDEVDEPLRLLHQIGFDSGNGTVYAARNNTQQIIPRSRTVFRIDG